MDARYYNGGPDDYPEYRRYNTTEQEPVKVCLQCGVTCDWGGLCIGGVGRFCSRTCADVYELRMKRTA
jgi:hypothetical protein